MVFQNEGAMLIPRDPEPMVQPSLPCVSALLCTAYRPRFVTYVKLSGPQFPHLQHGWEQLGVLMNVMELKPLVFIFVQKAKCGLTLERHGRLGQRWPRVCYSSYPMPRNGGATVCRGALSNKWRKARRGTQINKLVTDEGTPVSPSPPAALPAPCTRFLHAGE